MWVEEGPAALVPSWAISARSAFWRSLAFSGPFSSTLSGLFLDFLIRSIGLSTFPQFDLGESVIVTRCYVNLKFTRSQHPNRNFWLNITICPRKKVYLANECRLLHLNRTMRVITAPSRSLVYMISTLHSIKMISLIWTPHIL